MKLGENYNNNIDEFKLHEALGATWKLIDFANTYVNDHKPWEVVKDRPEHFLEIMTNLVKIMVNVSYLIYPFMPESSEKIADSFGIKINNLDDLKKENFENKKFVIKKKKVLFPLAK